MKESIPALGEMPTNNLPVHLTTLIGRENEIGELREMLAGSRLLTLTGAPGCGKTRLALAVAVEALSAFPDGTFLVELGPLADSVLVPQTIATIFGIREGPDRPLISALIEHLREKELLLLLDNCEHLLDACSDFLEAALSSCPGVRVVATSRELLGIDGELAFRVPSLTYPREGADQIQQDGAPRLFVDRAQLRLPAFRPTAEDWQAIGAICRHLDGIPLAIELAAAKIDVLSVPQILDHLSDRFRLLTGGRRRPGARQQTLRSTVDWSYLLLSSAEQHVFRRLAIFGGGFTLEAAEALSSTQDVGRDDVLDLVARLVQKSLVGVEQTDEGIRYRLLETLSEYGREKLLADGELSDVRDRHLQFFLGQAEAAFREWRTLAHSSWLRRLTRELENLRLALDWARGRDPGTWVRLAGALAWFWLYSGRLIEGRSRLEPALATKQGPDADRARALDGVCAIAYDQADFAALATFAAEQALLCERLGDRAGLASALTSLGAAALFKDQELLVAEGLLMQSLELTTRTGLPAHMSEALTMLGLLALARDDLESAQMHWDRSLQLCEEAGDVPQHVRMLVDITTICLIRGRVHDAARCAEVALAALHAAPGHYMGPLLLECYAWLAIEADDVERGLRLVGAAQAHNHRIGKLRRAPAWERFWAPVLRRTKARARPEVVDRALSDGARLDLDQAFALAVEGPRPAPEADRRYVEAAGIRLTRRERDVAVMVARGMSNRQIANRLVLTERTIEGHLEHLRNKLGFHSRAEVAAWVVANGLSAEGPA